MQIRIVPATSGTQRKPAGHGGTLAERLRPDRRFWGFWPHSTKPPAAADGFIELFSGALGAEAAWLGQPRPMLGRLPWFALLRRNLAFLRLVFFDIGTPSYGAACPPPTGRPVRFQRDAAHSVSSATGHVLTIRSIGTPRSAARLQPSGCHSS